ncbi:hypothetical protein N9L19_00960 [bacterium]|nr:hypothetical protein [bacterium]
MPSRSLPLWMMDLNDQFGIQMHDGLPCQAADIHIGTANAEV